VVHSNVFSPMADGGVVKCNVHCIAFLAKFSKFHAKKIQLTYRISKKRESKGYMIMTFL
jgi:hypothetical protein